MAGRKLIVIIDHHAGGDHVAEWQRQALVRLPPEDQLILLVCTNSRLARDPVRYPLYYALNLLAVRNQLTRQVPLGMLSATISARHEFASEQDGAWQRLPKETVDFIEASGAVAVIKLGMGLMRVPPELKTPVLSWHHGDPEHFRGRPAGFWELLSSSPVMGQIVQIIGNKLDAGAVVAFAETRILLHSWRATLIESFRHSPLLLAPALDNIAAGKVLAKPTTGRNYRLPPNHQVVRLCCRLAAAKFRRLAYGALFEKRWRVSTAPLGVAGTAAAIVTGQQPLPADAQWSTPDIPQGCAFTADPFFAEDGRGLLVEALSNRSGCGEIWRIDKDGSHRLSSAPGHHSYPALVAEDGETYCIPEIAQWSGPIIHRLRSGWQPVAALDIDDQLRLTDPTFLRHDGRLYLFANDAALGSGVLKLWSSDSLFGRFAEHPASPLRISPRGSRMGGDILSADGKLLRIGQDFTRDYGNGLIAFAIDELTPDSYRESEAGTLSLHDRKGPHSFNLSADGTTVLFDWYRDAFTPVAGIKRAIARLRHRKSRIKLALGEHGK